MDKIARRKQGLILIVVLWIMFFLSVAVLTLSAKNRMNIRLRSLNNESLRMFYLAQEGINRAIDTLIHDDFKFDSLDDAWAKKLILEKDEGKVSVQIIDENRFININNVSEEILNNLKLLFPEITTEQMSAIMKNRPFNLKSEVQDLLALGISNPEQASWLTQTDLLDMLTTFSNGTVNINTVSEKVMILIPNMTQAAAQIVIGHRQSNPFMSNDSLSEELSALGLSAGQVSSLVKVCKVSSNVFRITATAQAKDKHIARNLEVVVNRQDQKMHILLSKEN
jgi:type II secretory pathway component PulK